jgi:hypothetical protein
VFDVRVRDGIGSGHRCMVTSKVIFDLRLPICDLCNRTGSTERHRRIDKLLKNKTSGGVLLIFKLPIANLKSQIPELFSENYTQERVWIEALIHFVS